MGLAFSRVLKNRWKWGKANNYCELMNKELTIGSTPTR